MRVMSSPIRPQSWSWAEFVSYADSVQERAEFIDGLPVLQAAGTREHAQAVLGTATSLRVSLENTGCTAVTDGVWLRVGEDRFLPDVMVLPAGEPADGAREVTEALMIAEVMSGSTELRDRGRKWVAYRRLPSLRAYLLIDTVNHHVELFTQRKEAWSVVFLEEYHSITLPWPAEVTLPVHLLLGLSG